MKVKKIKEYRIEEEWDIDNEKEHYTNIVKTLSEVKKYIENWIEGWEESCEENGYEIEELDTDYKTFAKVKINKGDTTDEMKLTVKVIG
jgi:hypothetical protein